MPRHPDEVRTVRPWGDEETVTRLRQELYDAEVEMTEKSKACGVAQAAYHQANSRYFDARKALVTHLGLPT